MEPLLLPSFDAPYKFGSIDCPMNFDSEHLVWSRDDDSILAYYDPTVSKGTFFLFYFTMACYPICFEMFEC